MQRLPPEGGIGNKRQRGNDEVRPLAATCISCRSRKVKCDSQKPVCGNCQKNNEGCQYPFRSKPGLRPGAGMELGRRTELVEERLQLYEAQLAEQEARLSSIPAWVWTTPHNPFPQTLPQNPLPESSDSTALDFSSLLDPIDTTGNPIGLSQLGGAVSPFPHSQHSSTEPHVLPPPDIVQALIQLFFAHIHPWAPIIAPEYHLAQFSQPWSIVVHAIVAVSLRLSSDPRLQERKDDYKQSAKHYVFTRAIESTSIQSAQALAILALDLLGSEQGPSAWGTLALLTRSAVHLGLSSEEEVCVVPTPFGPRTIPTLNRTLITPQAISWREDEERRRLFWLIFVLDRYACVSTGWDFALPDSEVRRRLPCSDALWATDKWHLSPNFTPILHMSGPPSPGIIDTLSPLAHLVAALDHCGRANTLQRQEIDPGDRQAVERRMDMTKTLTGAAKRWLMDIKLEGKIDSMSLIIQAIHHSTILKLNGYYAFSAATSTEPLEPWTSICLESCRGIVTLTRQASVIGLQSTSPLFTWSCWIAARLLFVHAYLTHQNDPGDDFDCIVGSMKGTSPYWGTASQYVKLLERAKRKWLNPSDPGTDGSGTGPSALPGAIQAILDLRRTAYDAMASNAEATPATTPPPDLDFSQLPAWAVQPILGDLHSWFDFPDMRM
ncbi:fungal-specific transcription factor domain-domain-containing protein [Naematelia encephala]|uniref:Fungal-specific transcription factor domain-domain-containing protein n=1 Tax=Naematelia encephala TaxID=71784 RepID=A0A1Y2B8A1_9TREE|nr:fungal-specific transcription factor domain-domain-containing protein [Naematelia encephala]